MDLEPRGSASPERPPSIVPQLVLWGVGIIAGLMVLSWVLGAIFAILRNLLIAGVVIAVIWAIVASRRR